MIEDMRAGGVIVARIVEAALVRLDGDTEVTRLRETIRQLFARVNVEQDARRLVRAAFAYVVEEKFAVL